MESQTVTENVEKLDTLTKVNDLRCYNLLFSHKQYNKNKQNDYFFFRITNTEVKKHCQFLSTITIQMYNNSGFNFNLISL